MHKRAQKLTKIKTKPARKKTALLNLPGLKTTLRSYAYGKKFYIPKRMEIRDPLADNLNSSVPASLPASQSEAEVMKFFGDKVIQNWLQSAAVKNSSFGKAASTVEKAMKVEASITSADRKSVV